jgi:precorrin-2/cobalt-factor-2 C20-methyltransferase
MMGTFVGVGVGPGPAGYLPVAAWKAIQEADVILLPRGKESSRSVAGQCLEGLGIEPERLCEVVYNMETESTSLRAHYDALAKDIAQRLERGENVAYLTLGDSLTYSTYSYALQSLLALIPDLNHKTYPGVTSYAAIASAVDWPLGQGKERTLILPCPETKEPLKADIETHDIVILMKIGHRLPMVLSVLQEMSIAEYCAFAARIGLPGEVICKNVDQLDSKASHDYFTTMLIRKEPALFLRAE